MLMNIILNLAFIRRWRRGPRAPHAARPPAHAPARRFSALASTILAALAVLTACSSNPDEAASAGATDHQVRVVASTNVYGDIAAQIGGDRVHVTSIIDDPNQDPHSYEASPQNQLALSRARVIIENGGGYDDFMDVMRHSAARADAVVLDAVEISGRSDANPGLNEHVWYDFPSMGKLAAKLADALTQVDPGSAADLPGQRRRVHDQARGPGEDGGRDPGQARRRGRGRDRAGAAVPARPRAASPTARRTRSARPSRTEPTCRRGC